MPSVPCRVRETSRRCNWGGAGNSGTRTLHGLAKDKACLPAARCLPTRQVRHVVEVFEERDALARKVEAAKQALAQLKADLPGSRNRNRGYDVEHLRPSVLEPKVLALLRGFERNPVLAAVGPLVHSRVPKPLAASSVRFVEPRWPRRLRRVVELPLVPTIAREELLAAKSAHATCGAAPS